MRFLFLHSHFHDTTGPADSFLCVTDIQTLHQCVEDTRTTLECVMSATPRLNAFWAGPSCLKCPLWTLHLNICLEYTARNDCHVSISKDLKPMQSTRSLYLCSTQQDSPDGSSAKCVKFATHHVVLWRQVALDLTDILV